MAAGIVTLYGANKDAINIDDLLSASIKLALVANSYTPNVATGGDDTWSDVSAFEIANGNGYLTGGQALAAVAKAAIAGGWKLSSDDVTWNATPGNIPAWRYGVFYVDGTLWGLTNPVVGYFLGDTTPADIPATLAGNPLTIECPADGWFDVV